MRCFLKHYESFCCCVVFGTLKIPPSPSRNAFLRGPPLPLPSYTARQVTGRFRLWISVYGFLAPPSFLCAFFSFFSRGGNRLLPARLSLSLTWYARAITHTLSHNNDASLAVYVFSNFHFLFCVPFPSLLDFSSSSSITSPSSSSFWQFERSDTLSPSLSVLLAASYRMKASQ